MADAPKRGRVLIVDDEKDLLEMIRGLFADLPFNVSFVKMVSRALDRANERRFRRRHQ